MENNKINYSYITEYLNEKNPKKKGLLKELEEYAYQNKIPIIRPEVAQFILTITKIANPNNILEIGTAIAYSAIVLSAGLQELGKITTIEKDNQMANIAQENIIRANKQNTIKIINDDAKNVLPMLKGKYDLIFMDAAKGQYPKFLPACLSLLKTEGILITDNVLYKGMVANKALANARNKTIIKRLQEYNTQIMKHPDLISSIIPIGDGVAISYKKGNVYE